MPFCWMMAMLNMIAGSSGMSAWAWAGPERVSSVAGMDKSQAKKGSQPAFPSALLGGPSSWSPCSPCGTRTGRGRGAC